MYRMSSKEGEATYELRFESNMNFFCFCFSRNVFDLV